MSTLRKIEVLVSAAWLAIFLLGVLGNAVSPAVLVLGVAVLGGYFALRAVWPSLRRAARTVRPPDAVEVSLLPPPERYGQRGPVPFAALTRSLEQSGLGRVEKGDAVSLRLVTRAGEWLALATTSADATTLTDLKMETSSGDLAAFACDALVAKLGPITLRVDGVELFIDGTLPSSELERELHDRRVMRMHQLTRELHEIEDAPKPRSQYLN